MRRGNSALVNIHERKASIGGLGALRGAIESVGGRAMNPMGVVSDEK